MYLSYAARIVAGSWLESRFGSNDGDDDEREDRPGPRVDRHDGARAARETVVGRLLRRRVERERDGAALHAAAGEQLLHAVDEEAVVGAGQHVVLVRSMPVAP